MRVDVERGSGTVTSLVAVGGAVALGFGLLAGISVMVHATAALRAAERAAIAVATERTAGERDPCVRMTAPIVACSIDGLSATVTVALNGVRATAIAGPER